MSLVETLGEILLFPDRCRELVYSAGEKRVGYEAVREDWYQLDIHQFNQLREGEAKRVEVYEVAVQFRVYLVSELRGGAYRCRCKPPGISNLGDTITSISLMGATTMEFRKGNGPVVSVRVPQYSALQITGEL